MKRKWHWKFHSIVEITQQRVLFGHIELFLVIKFSQHSCLVGVARCMFCGKGFDSENEHICDFEEDVRATFELTKFVSDSVLKCTVTASNSRLDVVLAIRLEWIALTNPLTVGSHDFWMRFHTWLWQVQKSLFRWQHSFDLICDAHLWWWGDNEQWWALKHVQQVHVGSARLTIFLVSIGDGVSFKPQRVYCVMFLQVFHQLNARLHHSEWARSFWFIKTHLVIVDAPVVTSVTPTRGLIEGGNVVTVRGKNLIPSDTSNVVPSVKPLCQFTQQDAESLVAEVEGDVTFFILTPNPAVLLLPQSRSNTGVVQQSKFLITQMISLQVVWLWLSSLLEFTLSCQIKVNLQEGISLWFQELVSKLMLIGSILVKWQLQQQLKSAACRHKPHCSWDQVMLLMMSFLALLNDLKKVQWSESPCTFLSTMDLTLLSPLSCFLICTFSSAHLCLSCKRFHIWRHTNFCSRISLFGFLWSVLFGWWNWNCRSCVHFKEFE